MSRPEDHIYQDPLRGTLHLLGCRQQIIGKSKLIDVKPLTSDLLDNASVLYPDVPLDRFRIILEVDGAGRYRATLIYDPGNRERLEILLETNLTELLTPDMAYMNLMYVVARRVRERDVLRQASGMSGHPVSSGYVSADRE
jgi:hypothetical protein